MPSLEATLLSYARLHLPLLPQIYLWKFDPAVVHQSFALPVDGASWYDKTRALKRAIANQWHSSPERRGDIADYAVRVWGGVRSNAAATMQSYVHTISNGQLPQNHKGIASWSKVAAFSNPDQHAIFDARVSFSLNAIQILHGTGERLWFPHLPGRNTLLTATWPALKRQASQQGWARIGSTQVYPTYIELLHAGSAKLGVGVDDIEMLLFAKAEDLAREVTAACTADRHVS